MSCGFVLQNRRQTSTKKKRKCHVYATNGIRTCDLRVGLVQQFAAIVISFNCFIFISPFEILDRQNDVADQESGRL
jgi:hypothetical protein